MNYATTGVITSLISTLIVIGFFALIIYVLFYRIPKALIRFAIKTYFEEKYMMEHLNRQNPEIQYK